MNTTKYFMASAELLSKIKEINQQRTLALTAAEDLAKQFGGKPLHSRGVFCGVEFEGAAPAGWTKPKYTGGVRFSRPLKTKPEGRDAHEAMAAIPRVPGWTDILKLVGLDNHYTMTAPDNGSRGFCMRYSSGHYVGDQLVIEVPEADNYQGHKLLTEISKADFLQMQADHEREKDTATADH